MDTANFVRQLLKDVLQIGTRADQLSEDTPLLGHMPELDSMAVATLIAAIEDQLDLEIYDDEISAETFETFGALTNFVAQKLDQ